MIGIQRGKFGETSRRSSKERGRAFHQMPSLLRLDRLPRSRPSVPAPRSAPTPSAGSTEMTGAQFEIRIDGTPRTE